MDNPSPVTAQLPNPTPKSDFKKWLVVILIFLALLVFGSGLYLWLGSPKANPTAKQTAATYPTPTTDPTATWKTYTNSEFNFSLKYPSDLEMYYDQNRQILSIRTTKEHTEEEIPKAFDLAIEVSINSGNLTLNELTKKPKIRRDDESSNFTNLDKDYLKPYSNNSIKGIIYKARYNNGDQSFDYEGINMIKNNLIYFISFDENGSFVGENAKNTIDQILSTFKFTN